MDRTWPARRALIVAVPPTPIREVLETYPLLREPHQLLKEFERVTGVDAVATVPGKLKDFSKTLITKACEKSDVARKIRDGMLPYSNNEIKALDTLLFAGRTM